MFNFNRNDSQYMLKILIVNARIKLNLKSDRLIDRQSAKLMLKIILIFFSIF